MTQNINSMTKWEQLEYSLWGMTKITKEIAKLADEIYADMMSGRQFMPLDIKKEGENGKA